MKMPKKPKAIGPTVDEQSEINAIASGLMQQWFAAGWKLRTMNPDYHVDYLLERVEGRELTGRLVYLQQKAHRKVEFKNGFANEIMERKHLRYYADKIELPVFLVTVDTVLCKAWYVFLQEWIDQNLGTEKLNGDGTRTVKVPESQPLDDVPAFLAAFSRGLVYMREKHPGSVTAAMSAEERRIMALDPRFRVRLDIVDGKKTYHLIPKEDVTVNFKVTGENVKLFREHFETGKPIMAKSGGIFVQGLPALEFHSPQGAIAELSLVRGKPLEVQWSLWSEGDSVRFKLTLDGTMTMGDTCYLFQGWLKGGPLKVEIRIPLPKDPQAGRAKLNLSWELACWEGQPVGSLSHFEGVRALMRTMVAGDRVAHVFHVNGRDIFPGDCSFPKSDDPGAFERFDFIHACRVAAKGFKVNPNLPSISTITGDDDAHVRMLADLAATGVHTRSGPGMRINVTLEEIFDPAEMLRRADNPNGSYRAVRPNQVTKLIGQEVEVGELEYTLAPARLILSPEMRTRLKAGDKTGFSTEICGTTDAVFTVRRILPTEEAKSKT